MIKAAPEKECLHMFGGPVSIKEYRKDFMRVTNYEWIERFFRRNPRVSNTFYHVKESYGRLRPIKPLKRNMTSIQIKEEEEETIKPPVVRDKKKKVSYFN